MDVSPFGVKAPYSYLLLHGIRSLHASIAETRRTTAFRGGHGTHAASHVTETALSSSHGHSEGRLLSASVSEHGRGRSSSSSSSIAHEKSESTLLVRERRVLRRPAAPSEAEAEATSPEMTSSAAAVAAAAAEPATAASEPTAAAVESAAAAAKHGGELPCTGTKTHWVQELVHLDCTEKSIEILKTFQVQAIMSRKKMLVQEFLF